MTADHDWRRPLPTRPCAECATPETRCDAGRIITGRPCCPDCNHDEDQP